MCVNLKELKYNAENKNKNHTLKKNTNYDAVNNVK